MPFASLADKSRPDRWMYWSVVAGLRWHANVAVVWSYQPARARSVKQRWRSVCVLKRGTSALKAIRRTILDQLPSLLGGWSPGQCREAWDQPAPAVTGEATARCIATSADRAGLAQTLLDEMIVKKTDGNQAELHGRVGQANSRIDRDHIGSASTRAVGKIVHVAGDLAAISAERIDAVSFAKGQVISQRTTIGVD